MRINLIGGSGFIGNALAVALSDVGYDAIVSDIRPPKANKVRYQYMDVRDLSSLRCGVEDGDIIVFLAAVHGSDDAIEDYFHTNVGGMRNLIAVVSKLRTCRVVFFSSFAASIAERWLGGEYSFDQKGLMYGLSKLQAEHHLQMVARLRDIQVCIIRPTAVFGKGNRGNFGILLSLIERFPIKLWDFGVTKSFCMLERLVEFTVPLVVSDGRLPQFESSKINGPASSVVYCNYVTSVQYLCDEIASASRFFKFRVYLPKRLCDLIFTSCIVSRLMPTLSQRYERLVTSVDATEFHHVVGMRESKYLINDLLANVFSDIDG